MCVTRLFIRDQNKFCQQKHICSGVTVGVWTMHVRASEACEPWLRVMLAKMASQHANHTVIVS